MVAPKKAARKVSASPSASSADGLGARLVATGTMLGGLGVSIAMLPGGYNPFGPTKAFVLVAACALVGAGFAAGPGLALDAWWRGRRSVAWWAAGALMLLAVLATFTSVAPEQSLVGHYPEYQGLLLLIASAVIGFGAFALAAADAPGAWRLMGRAAACVVLAVFAYALLQYIGVDPLPYQREFVLRRVRSTLGNASNLGVFAVLALPLVVARAREELGAWRWVSAGAAVAGALTLAWSLSRGAWVGAAVGAIAWLAAEGRAWPRARRVRVAAVATLAAVTLVAAVAVAVPNAGSRLASMLDPSAGTPGWRLEVWGISAGLVAARAPLGYGPGSYRYVFPEKRTAAALAGETGAQVLEDPHNVLASVAVSAGVPALIALMLLFAMALLAAWRLREGLAASRAATPRALATESRDGRLASPALLASLAAGLMALQFHFFTLDTAPLAAMLIGLAAGAGAGARERTGAGAGAGAREGADAAADAATTRAARTGRPVAPAPGPAATPLPSPAHPAPTVIVRWCALAIATLFAIAALLAGGLVLADRSIASGYALVAGSAPWPDARLRFERAQALAPWEPSMTWALGRGATQHMSATGDTAALPDAEQAMTAVMRRLPDDPLVVAQTSDVYLIAGLASRDQALLGTALNLAEKAIEMDPQNGYRWESKAAALAGLGRTPEAIGAYQRAVQYAPDDRQAWLNLAQLLEQSGRQSEAVAARQRAERIAVPNTP